MHFGKLIVHLKHTKVLLLLYKMYLVYAVILDGILYIKIFNAMPQLIFVAITYTHVYLHI